jgi:hypothetical protein
MQGKFASGAFARSGGQTTLFPPPGDIVMHSFVNTLAFVLVASISHAAQAASFCVGSSTELKNALQTASSNGEADSIRIESGVYAGNSATIAFAYATSQDFALLIAGGYESNPPSQMCYRQHRQPSETILTGSNARRVMQLFGTGGTHGDISLSNLTIRDGYTSGAGYIGGLDVGGAAGFSGDVKVSHVIFEHNTSTHSGSGGMRIGSDGGQVAVRDNLFLHNRCNSSNCAFSATVNYPSSSTARAFFGNNTIVANTCTQGALSCACTGARTGGSARSVIYNNAFAFNGNGDLCLQGGPAELFNNAVGPISGTPDIESGTVIAPDPGFVNPFGFDYRPALASPLVNQGTDEFPISLDDLDGHDRVSDGAVDIGAYENGDRIFTDGFEDSP